MATPRAFPALQTLVLFNGNEFICSPNDEDRLQGGECLGCGTVRVSTVTAYRQQAGCLGAGVKAVQEPNNSTAGGMPSGNSSAMWVAGLYYKMVGRLADWVQSCVPSTRATGPA